MHLAIFKECTPLVPAPCVRPFLPLPSFLPSLISLLLFLPSYLPSSYGDILQDTKDEILAGPGESTTGDASTVIDTDFQDQVVAADNILYDIGTNGYARIPTFSGWVKPLVESYSENDVSYFAENNPEPHRQQNQTTLPSSVGAIQRLFSRAGQEEWEREFQLQKENIWDRSPAPHGFKTIHHGMFHSKDKFGRPDTEHLRRLEALNGKYVSRQFSGLDNFHCF